MKIIKSMPETATESLVNIGQLLNNFLQQAISYAPRILLALIVLWIGFRIIKWVVKLLDRFFESKDYDRSLRSFLSSLVSIILKITLLIAVASTLGIATTSFVAILGAASLAIGLALQGSLANFAGGVMILLFKPFQVDDYVKVGNLEGFVKDINIFVTRLVTPDGITHYIPNGPLSNGNISNYSREGKVRLHIPIGIAYDADIEYARKVLLNAANNHKLVLNQPAPAVIVTELADSSVNLDLMVWCHPLNQPGVTADMKEAAKNALDSANIEIPFPQQVLHNIAK